jgi:hypothetical protein
MFAARMTLADFSVSSAELCQVEQARAETVRRPNQRWCRCPGQALFCAVLHLYSQTEAGIGSSWKPGKIN